MKSCIPTDPEERKKLVTLAQQRFLASNDYYRTWHEKWARYYKIYRGIKDVELDSDDFNTSLPYAFGIVENIAAKSSEAAFSRRPPCKVLPRAAGQEEAAENFATMATNYYAGSDYQIGKMRANKQKVITGNSWELDGWANEYIMGRIWSQGEGMLEDPTMETPGGKQIALKDSRQVPYKMRRVEKQIEIPVKIGYFTQFPSVFDVHPQPRVMSVEQMAWLLHEVREVAISDLQKQFYIDPMSGQKVPVYDLTELINDAGEHQPGAIRPVGRWGDKDLGEQVRRALSGTDNKETAVQVDGVDKVWLVDVYENNRLFTIAQGRYIIRCVEDYLHRPRLPWRLQGYTLDPESLYYIGALEPVEQTIYELDDTHNLTMQNFFRLVHKMVAYDPEKVPFVDDFKPRAGGRIRVRTEGGDIRTAIVALDQPDVIRPMLEAESNARGLIEWGTSQSDLSPGTEGSKQNHKTLGGLMEIQRNMNTRFVSLLRLDLANFQKQMESMEAFVSQFGFESRPYRQYREDGSTMLVHLSSDDIYTAGTGFDYAIEIDPSAGDDQMATNQLMVAFEEGLKYEQWAAQFGGPQAKRLDMGDIFRRILLRLGWFDTSQTLRAPSGVRDPGEELNLILSGAPVRVQPGEDLINHLTEHLIQLRSPKMQAGVAAGKADPNAMQNLALHVQETVAAIQAIMKDPEKAAMGRFAAAMGSAPAAMGGMR